MKTLIQQLTDLSLKCQITLMTLFFSLQVNAQNDDSGVPSLPKIGPASSVNAQSDPGSIFVTLFKWAGAIAIWIAVAWYGLIMFGATIKAANEARGGETSWMEAGKSLLGNVLMFVVFLAIAIWYSAAFLA